MKYAVFAFLILTASLGASDLKYRPPQLTPMPTFGRAESTTELIQSPGAPTPMPTFGHAESTTELIALPKAKFYEELQKIDRDDWEIFEKFLETQAKAGQIDAMYELGVSAFIDWGFCDSAKKWLGEAFRVGQHPLAALYMGDFYAKGCRAVKGLKSYDPDSRLAMFWYKKAAKRNVSRACMEIGVFYLSGKGVPKNKREAIRWFKKGAAMPDPYEGNRLQLEELEEEN